MEVIIHGTEELAKFVAGLVREGLTFKAYPNHDGDSYTVKLTGGF